MSTAPPEVIALRRTLCRGGYDPLPLYGKLPPVYRKNNNTKGLDGWQKLGAINDGQLKTWEVLWPDAINTGILTRTVPALDADILNPEASEAIEDLVRGRFEEHGHVMVRIGLAPKRAFLFRTDTPFDKITINFEGEQKLEFLCDGQQVVVDGIHPDTGKPYAWFYGEPCQVKRADLPAITAAGARELAEDVSELLVREHGYVRSGARPKGNGHDTGAGGGGSGGSADWQYLIDNIRAGRDLHDSIRDLAAKLVRSGMDGGAAVNFLRAQMESHPEGARDGRWKDRYDDIPRQVSTAEQFRESRPDARDAFGAAVAGQMIATARARVEAEDEHEPPQPSINDITGYDVDWTKPYGLLGEMTDHVLATSRRPNRPLAVASAVATLSTVCGRWLYSPTGSALNVYIAMLAATAVGKNRPLSAVEEFLRAAGLGKLHQVAKAFSVSAFEQMLVDTPCCAAVVDEVGANLMARLGHKKASTHEPQIEHEPQPQQL